MRTSTNHQYRHLIDIEWMQEFNRMIPLRQINLDPALRILVVTLLHLVALPYIQVE